MSWLLVGLLLSVVHLNESFEGNWPPAGWSILDLGTQNNDAWEQTSQVARTGTFSAAVFFGPQGIQQNEWLITPALDLSGASQAYLLFYEAEEYWSGYGDHHRIRVCTGDPTDTANFTVVLDMTPSNHTIQGFDGDPVVVDLSAFAGQSQVYVAFQYTGVWADNWFLDDVTIYSPEEHDVSVEDLDLPLFARLNTSYTPRVKVHNWGMNTETFPVALMAFLGTDLVYADTAVVSSLAPGTETEVSFLPLMFTQAGPDNEYLLLAKVLLAGDGEPGNDSLLRSTYVLSQDRRVLLELTTNTGCGPCKPANDTLDVLMVDFGNQLAAIRYHAWWPSSSDPFYQANIPENTARIEYYGADYAPHLHIDGTLRDGEYLSSQWRQMIQEELQIPSGMNLSLSGAVDTLTGAGYVVAELSYVDGLPYPDLHLRAALVEDSLYYPSPNGQTWHFQVMRDMLPDPVGMALALSPGETVVETLHFTVDPQWNWHHCEVVVFVQDDHTRHVAQANRLYLTEMVSVEETPEPEARVDLRVPGVLRGTLKFAVVAVQPGVYTVEVFNTAGQRVWQHRQRVPQARALFLEVPRDRLASGVYLLQLKYEGRPVKRARTVLLR